MTRLKVWDPFVRIFHWSLVCLFALNALVVDDEGKLHIWIGYLVLALVAARIVWGFAGSTYARFSSFPPSVHAAAGQLRDIATGRTEHHGTGHSPLGAWMIYNLLAAILVISATGIMMTTNAFWGVKWVEEAHEIAVLWAEVSALLHVAAVVFESRRTGVNLPAAMVTGYKNIRQES